MGSVNKAILVGNLGRDAEMRFTAGGTPVATVSIATTERFTDRDGQKREDTQWHRIVIWGKTAESLHEYLTKGKQIYVEGRIEYRQWQDKDGQTRYSTEINVRELLMLGGARGGGGGGDFESDGSASRSRAPAAQKAKAASGGGDDFEDFPGALEDEDDDLPF